VLIQPVKPGGGVFFFFSFLFYFYSFLFYFISV
jgi:hypothetical protein